MGVLLMLITVIRRCYICIIIDLTKLESYFWKGTLGCITTAELFTLTQPNNGAVAAYCVYFFCDYLFVFVEEGWGTFGQTALHLSIMHTPNQHKHTPQSFIRH